MNEQDTTHALTNLYHAHTKVAKARATCEAASANLELERIKERMHELRSQHEPLASMIGGDILTDDYARQRQNINDAIFYIVIGRTPTKP